MVENLEKDAVGVPRGAAAYEFSVCCTQRVEDGVVEFAIVCDKVEFVSVNHVQGGAADGFGVVWEGFDAAAVCEKDLGSLRLESGSGWKFVGEGCYAAKDAFGLSPRWSDNAYSAVWMSSCVPEQQCAYEVGFSALTAPSCSAELVILKYICEFCLVRIRLKTDNMPKKIHGVRA